MSSSSSANDRPSSATRPLTARDVASLIIAIVIGTAIFKAPPLIFSFVASPAEGLVIWVLGGVIALAGGLCYAELAAAYPSHGAEYAYLSRAYGARLGFIFVWVQVSIVITGSIGAMAFVFADYTAELWPSLGAGNAWVAAVAIVLLSAFHLCGMTTGMFVQNSLTVAKLLALSMIVLAGFTAMGSSPVVTAVSETATPNYGLALVFVLYAYGGWNDVATVTPDLRDPQRDLTRGLLGGIAFVAVAYLVLNSAYVAGLGFDGLRGSAAPAADLIERSWGAGASKIMSLSVMISALGAIHGMLFTAPRMLSEVGRDYALFHRLSRWNAVGVPVLAILTVSGISLLLVVAIGTAGGRGLLDQCLSTLRITPPEWEKYDGGFGTLVAGSAPVFWFFFALSGMATVVLRINDPNTQRPFRMPLYPLPVVIFVTASLFMLHSALSYAGRLTLFVIPLLGLGAIFAIAQTKTPPAVNEQGL